MFSAGGSEQRRTTNVLVVTVDDDLPAVRAGGGREGAEGKSHAEEGKESNESHGLHGKYTDRIKRPKEKGGGGRRRPNDLTKTKIRNRIPGAENKKRRKQLRTQQRCAVVAGTIGEERNKWKIRQK